MLFLLQKTMMNPNRIINMVLPINNILLVIGLYQVHSQKIHRRNCRNEAIFKANGTSFVVKANSSTLIATMNAPLLPNCARRCIKTNGCKSVIYKKEPATPTEKNCQILNAEKADLTSDEIESSTGWIYYEPLQQGTSRCPVGKCAAGFQCLENCSSNSHSCVDIDECQSNPCQNGGTCNNHKDSYSCTCVTGFTGTNCQTSLCPSSWVFEGNYCYYFSQIVNSWSGARSSCQQQGGDLAIISNSTESAFVASKIVPQYWIGATDQAMEGVFKWVDGTALNYQPWCDREPSGGDASEDCLMVKSCGWNDDSCSLTLKYVCKKLAKTT